MPRSQRKLNKRTLDQARTHCAYIENYLDELEQQYAELHPDIARALHSAREVNAMLDDLIAKTAESI